MRLSVVKILGSLIILVLGLSPLASWGAEAGLLAFVRGGNLWLADSSGGNARQLTSGGKVESPAISRDGQWVAWVVTTGERENAKREIFLAPTAGGPARKLNLPGIHEAWGPSFSPDGKKLALVTRFNLRSKTTQWGKEEYATHAVSLVDLNTGQVRHLKQTPNHFMDGGDLYEAPAVSPDGRLIAYQESGTDVSGGFVVLDQNGKRVMRFPQDPEKDYRPYWRPGFSPDGLRILCFSMATNESEQNWIYLVDLKTRKATRVTEGCYPTFVDGGPAIVFERRVGNFHKTTGINLWRLDLASGAQPRLILRNAEKPAGSG